MKQSNTINQSKILFTLFLAISLLSSCKQEEILTKPEGKKCAGGTQYTIKSGKHNSTSPADVFSIVLKNSMRFQVCFDDTAAYDFGTNKNQGDINKLYGFTDCSRQTTESSARIGWNWNVGSKTIDLYSFTHVNGRDDFRSQLITKVKPGDITDFEIIQNDSSYTYNLLKQVEGKKTVLATFTEDRRCRGDFKYKARTYPFFGGQEVAPHDVNIWISERNALANDRTESMDETLLRN